MGDIVKKIYTCPKCLHEISYGDRICKHCGGEIIDWFGKQRDDNIKPGIINRMDYIWEKLYNNFTRKV